MDIVITLIGVILLITGASKKDRQGSRTGGGIALLTIGCVVTAVGALWFTNSFIYGFTKEVAKNNLSPVSSSVGSITPPPVYESQNAGNSTFQSGFKSSFVQSCEQNADASYCGCMADYMINNYTGAQLVEFSAEYKNTGQIPQALRDGASYCTGTNTNSAMP